MGDGKSVNKFVIVGLQGAGKSYAIKNHFVKRDPDTFVIDVQKEYEEAPFRYVPKATKYEEINKEIEQVINRLIIPNCSKINGKRWKQSLNTVIFDEADAYFKTGRELPHYAKRFFVDCRHLMLENVVTASRRMMDVNHYIRHTADYVIAFKQAGTQDLNTLEEFAAGAKETMKTKIDYKKHNLMIFNRERRYTVLDSWEELDDYLKSEK